MLAVAFLLFGPVSFFFSSIYSEALFLPLAIGCIDRARRGRWWQAGALGALAGLTRFIGLMLVIPLVWQYAESHLRAGRGLRGLRLGLCWPACCRWRASGPIAFSCG
jgi:Gpi18-like mannosyltransferase